MVFTETNLKDCYLIEPRIFIDERGYFMESFNERNFQNQTGIAVHFVQDNQSKSSKGVLRGLHYQTGIYSQAKLVRVLEGEVYDVVVDIRPESNTYGQQYGVVLSAENQKQLFVPKGFAHGFLVLSETATFFYKCDEFYNKEFEAGIIFNDPSLNIDWQIPTSELIISEKDKVQPLFKNALPVW
jgi:dTDP-4-dehydrorhamnose 3,5-epimerase